MRQGGLTEREIYEKEESIIRSYRRAIDLGQRSSAIVRETVKLLFKHKRGSEALDLVNSIPGRIAARQRSRAAGTHVRGRKSRFPACRGDRAKGRCRKTGRSSGARILLIQILLNRGRSAEAETVIREAVDLSKTDPDRWIVLVQFLVLTKQPGQSRAGHQGRRGGVAAGTGAPGPGPMLRAGRTVL